MALRRQALTVDPEELDLASTAQHPCVWCLLMETGVGERTASLLAVVDGTVSLYFSTGGGVIGAGGVDAVRAAALEMIKVAEEFVDQMEPTTEYPLPADGMVRFYLRTFSGTFTAEAEGIALGRGATPLAPLFIAGHTVISAIREADERRTK